MRSIIGCQNLNCDGYKSDPQYADHNYNNQYIGDNQAAYLMGRTEIGTGKTTNQLINSNFDKDPLGNTIARTGATLLAGAVTGGLATGLLSDVAAAWSSGTAFWYAGDAVSYQVGLSKDQPSYQTAASAGAIGAAFAPLTLPLTALGTSAAAQAAVGIYNALVAGTGAYGTTTILNTATSPDLSGGLGVGTGIAGGLAQGVVPGPMGTVLGYLFHIVPGPIQAAIENAKKLEIRSEELRIETEKYISALCNWIFWGFRDDCGGVGFFRCAGRRLEAGSYWFPDLYNFLRCDILSVCQEPS